MKLWDHVLGAAVFLRPLQAGWGQASAGDVGQWRVLFWPKPAVPAAPFPAALAHPDLGTRGCPGWGQEVLGPRRAAGKLCGAADQESGIPCSVHNLTPLQVPAAKYLHSLVSMAFLPHHLVPAAGQGHTEVGVYSFKALTFFSMRAGHFFPRAAWTAGMSLSRLRN